MDYPYKFAALVLDGHSTAEAQSGLDLRLDASQPFTIDAWVRPVDAYMKKSIFRQENVIDFGIDRDSVYLSISGYPMITSTPQNGAVEQDVWTHVCAVYNGSAFILFVNGVSNVNAAASGSCEGGNGAFVFGSDFCGAIKQTRIFKKALDSDAVMRYMLGGDMADEVYRNALAACYDFAQVPAREVISGELIALKKNARQDGFSNGAIFKGNAFIEIDDDPQINPGGKGSDSYTVQSWVYLEPSELETRHVIFANGDVMDVCGMTLYIEKEGESYKVKNLRASDTEGEDSILTSKADIPVRQWVNIAATYSFDTLRIYINGVLDNILGEIFPLSNTLDEPLSRIGSELVANNENGQDWFSGAISRLDIWNIALGESNIQRFMLETPLPEEDGLLANFNFHMSDNTNVCTGEPSGGRNNVVFGELQYRLAKGASVAPERTSGQAREPLPKDLLERFRAEALSSGRADFFSALRKENQLPDSTPSDFLFTVTSHRIDGTLYFVAHDKDSSYTMCCTDADISPMTQWWFELLLIVVGGLIDVVLGIKIINNAGVANALQSLVLRLQRNPSIYTALKTAADWTYIKSFVSILCVEGMLKEIFSAILSGFSWWQVAYAIGKITFLALASAYGAWAYYLVALSLLAAEVIYHITKFPQEVPAIGVASISFHESGVNESNSWTVPLRRNNSASVDVPEWTSDKPKVVSAAAYCIGRCKGAVTIKVSFQCDDKSASDVKVRCEDVSAAKLFGNSDEATVKMKDQKSDYTTFTFASHQLGSVGIKRTALTLRWSHYETSTGKWIKTSETEHAIYTLLDIPQVVWDYQKGPWVKVLDYACSWAKGKKTAEEAAAAVTQAVNGNLRLKYDAVSGSPSYVINIPKGTYKFKLTNFLNFLDGKNGYSNIVNCTDCATIVATFANALGCRLSEKRMWYDFLCNPIIAIGYGDNDWKPPFSGYGFGYHEVCMVEPLDGKTSVKPAENNYLIYDACLHVDGSENPGSSNNTTRRKLLPIGMVFSIYGDEDATPRKIPLDASYREHLATNSSNGVIKCKYYFEHNKIKDWIYKPVI